MAEARAKGTRPRVGGLAARVSERRGDLNSRRVRRRRGRRVDIPRGRARSRRKPVSSPRTTRAGASDRAAASDRPGRAALGVEPRGDARAGVGPERRLVVVVEGLDPLLVLAARGRRDEVDGHRRGLGRPGRARHGKRVSGVLEPRGRGDAAPGLLQELRRARLGRAYRDGVGRGRRGARLGLLLGLVRVGPAALARRGVVPVRRAVLGVGRGPLALLLGPPAAPEARERVLVQFDAVVELVLRRRRARAPALFPGGVLVGADEAARPQHFYQIRDLHEDD
mmetsp:Transcript_7178/g.21046  ORF Transcript_7178/g.21046 Transcript_7178/m.21046 type:complete len:281 (+) Transcript_7178:1060-1902(+)